MKKITIICDSSSRVVTQNKNNGMKGTLSLVSSKETFVMVVKEKAYGLFRPLYWNCIGKSSKLSKESYGTLCIEVLK